MGLAPGTRIGNYEIISALGAGGMGEVYRGRDTRLDRAVAIKALPQAFARDPERLARFEREAKLLASLSHPNIGGIYGIEDVGGAPHLVLEFIEGTTLGTKLAAGPLATREALDVCGQIAAGLEAAHERGIVHRDLKPGNVMITPSRAVKVLDFGLAKGGATEGGSSPDLTTSPTIAMTATGQGVILGTASYMSPEQARGKAVDRRADVWAFGCVLFECFSGRRAFPGETPSDVIARILERDADWTMLPATIPSRLRDLVSRCLTKEVDARPRDIGDLRRELSAIAAEMSSPSVLRIAAAETPSLAVLYFENLASDPESEYFCAGITEDILTDLSKIKGLRVASRNAVSRYRGAPADIAKVGTELGVKAVLEGSVRRAGDRVRISAQLINAADGFHVWAERYDRTLDDVFAVQEEIASSIAKALRGALSPAETRELQRDRPDDVRAYDLYLKGREHYGKYSTESLQQALGLFQEATRIEPNYALAWAGIADCHGQLLAHSAGKDDAELARKGLDAARRAIAIDPKLAEAHKAEALVLRYSGDMAGARAALTRALEVNPRFVPALLNLAIDHFSMGSLAAAERLVRKAIDADPQHEFALGWLSILVSFTNRVGEVLPIIERMEQLSTGNAFYTTLTCGMRAHICLKGGDVEGLERILGNARSAGAEPHCVQVLEAVVAMKRGRSEDARRLLYELVHSTELLPGYTSMLAKTAIELGEPDRAVQLFIRPGMADFAPMLLRLSPELHALLDRKPFAPRRWDAALVWPLEAPMIDATLHAMFREVRIESGRPQASDASVQ